MVHQTLYFWIFCIYYYNLPHYPPFFTREWIWRTVFSLETAQSLATKRSWNMQSKYFDKFIRTATIRSIPWCIFNSSGNNKSIWCVLEAEAYSEPCQTCKMERLAKIVNCYKLLTITGKSSILDIWLDTK